MNVLHVITGLNDGGAEGVLYRLLLHDRVNNHQVVSLMDLGKYGPLLTNRGFTVDCLNMPSGIITIRGLYELFKIIKYTKPDILQTWMYHADFIGGIIGKIAGVKKICWGIRQSTLEFRKSSFKTILIARFNAFLSYFIPDSIICCSKSGQEVHLKIGYSKKKMIYVPNGYDLSCFKINNELRAYIRLENFKVLESDFIIGMVARFNPQKDHANLINALGFVKKSCYSFKLVLIGKDLDHQNKKIVKQIFQNQLEDDVLLLGQRDDIMEIMNGLDLHVLSSSFGEGFPNVLAEGMACAVPCITTNVGDAAHVVGKTGWVVKPKKPKDLADAIIQAINEKKSNNELWLKRKLECRYRIKNNFSIAKMVKNYCKVWRA